MFYRLKDLVKFTSRAFGYCLWFIFYGVKFYVDFTSDFFDSSSSSNLMVKCINCVYCSNLWNKFTGQVCGCYFGTHFMRSYSMPILGVGFLVVVFSLMYG